MEKIENKNITCDKCNNSLVYAYLVEDENKIQFICDKCHNSWEINI